MLAPWMIRELERQEQLRRRESDRPAVRVPQERPQAPREEAEPVRENRGVHILDISPLPENVTLL